MELWSAFLIGLTGSMHCAGMCGPLLLALPLSSENRFSSIAGRLIYNLGRITSYMFLGLIFGFFGRAAYIFGLQQNMSILLGIVIIFFVIAPYRFKNIIIRSALAEFYNGKLQSYVGKALKKNSAVSLLGLGMLNGLLPCGLVYVGLAGAAASNGQLNGIVFMASFGLGTLPLMLTMTVAGKYAGIGLRRKLKNIVPLFAFLLGVVFILRGMDLGIPYLSPKFSKNMNSSGMKSAVIKPALNKTTEGGCGK